MAVSEVVSPLWSSWAGSYQPAQVLCGTAMQGKPLPPTKQKKKNFFLEGRVDNLEAPRCGKKDTAAEVTGRDHCQRRRMGT
jgi:hypothetical protein